MAQIGGGHPPSATATPMGDLFDKLCPWYLSIGMSWREFWRDDPEIARHYREAQTLRKEYENQMLWLQGMYVYDALCAASPIFRSLAKRGTKAHPYVKEPYQITKRETERNDEETERRRMEKGRAMMQAFMASHNKKLEEQPKEQ